MGTTGGLTALSKMPAGIVEVCLLMAVRLSLVERAWTCACGCGCCRAPHMRFRGAGEGERVRDRDVTERRKSDAFCLHLVCLLQDTRGLVACGETMLASLPVPTLICHSLVPSLPLPPFPCSFWATRGRTSRASPPQPSSPTPDTSSIAVWCSVFVC